MKRWRCRSAMSGSGPLSLAMVVAEGFGEDPLGCCALLLNIYATKHVLPNASTTTPSCREPCRAVMLDLVPAESKRPEETNHKVVPSPTYGELAYT